jgi:hypothetical protein
MHYVQFLQEVSQIQLQVFSCICSKQDRNLQTIENNTATGSILDTKNMQVIYANQGKVDETGATLVTSPRKSLAWRAQQTGMSSSWAQSASKLLYLHPCKTLVHTSCVTWLSMGCMP